MRDTRSYLLVVLAAVALGLAACAGAPPKAASTGCNRCHDAGRDASPQAPGRGRRGGSRRASPATLPNPDTVGPNGYSARLHRAHVKAGADCAICHVWKANESFGIIGTPGSLGTLDAEDLGRVKKATDTWAGSPYLAARHGEKHGWRAGRAT